MSESFSFRWGISILDAGDTRIPNWMFDHYIEAGVTRSEFLTILHLSRYQFEKEGSECRPSIPTIAQQMGYSPRGLRKLLAGLEQKEFDGTHLLIKHFRAGKTTIYDFSGFSRAVLSVYLAYQQGVNPSSPPNKCSRDEPQFRGGMNPSSGVGMNPSSAKEKKIIKKSKNDDDETPTKLDTDIYNLLLNLGVWEVKAKEYTRTYSGRLAEVKRVVERAEGASNPGAAANAMLRDGEIPAQVKPQTPRHKRYRVPDCEPAQADELVSNSSAEEFAAAKTQKRASEVQTIWEAAKVELALQMTRATYNQWIGPTRALERTNSTWRIGCENERIKDWLDNRLRRTVERTLACVVGDQVSIEFVVSGG